MLPEVLRLADAPSQPSLVPEHQSEESINTVNARDEDTLIYPIVDMSDMRYIILTL